ncbi:hypothetical protein Acid345_4295 [Candidatus Koribacter versatilis Ellin345]|uniref:Uncharacterized protein n=1 Tax=Koribacter versatilis (strain Ellin345) TaxID=204669 RepID=Q1IIK5_KORVE|nr:hypothetical protein [Candidatus Koribacter versatilis]ABF43295.1 hypothetical protein Acid345_4295 [Candidatus Koribacter versatilis Ellin345]
MDAEPIKMDVEKTITDIEKLEEIHALPDTRPITMSDREVANRIHDEIYANNPWFKLWQHFGVSSRTDPPSLNLPQR